MVTMNTGGRRQFYGIPIFFFLWLSTSCRSPPCSSPLTAFVSTESGLTRLLTSTPAGSSCRFWSPTTYMFPLLKTGPEPPPLPSSVYVLLRESDPGPGPKGEFVVQSRTKGSQVPGHRGWFQDEHVAKSEPVKPIDCHWEF